MTVRITVSEDREGHLIRVEGRLSCEEVNDLEQAVGDDPMGAILELTELRSADAAALTALRNLHTLGVALRGIGPHLAWRVEEPSS